ncbi:hypothetical protein FEM03_03020 [Phragmitibacter flavus]|uniref:Uncharacterized protein n=1 Tax=Phragmitibacter flavus TaxID=2576071 RepID=A0A5R8KJ83_9BACT|nr:hypothetical protein [Phragmitibacter flavus]TLD72342.1 hypothetical protein FEM03_03020 [Phragmitibacter flavus]
MNVDGKQRERLLAKFRGKVSLTKSGVGTSKGVLETLRELMEKGEVVKLGTHYFLAGSAPTMEREKLRLDRMLRGTHKLFKGGALRLLPKVNLPSTRAALDALVDERVVLRLEILKDKKAGFLYLHSCHASAGVAGDMGEDLGGRIRRAYGSLVKQSANLSVFIADLAVEAGLETKVLQEWLQTMVVERGLGTLDEGDWSYASEAQRAAAMVFRDRRRLYVRLHEEDRLS